jgi:ribonuclease-3
LFGDLSAFETKLGYSFRDRDILKRALTHASRACETAGTLDRARHCNEQLEFLGDAVLGLMISEMLVERFPSYAEGHLSKLKSRLVSAHRLHEAACELGIGEHLLLGRGEELSGGRTKKTLLADALEAVIAAIYLDGGHLEAKRFVERKILVDVQVDAVAEPDNFKSALQETSQARGLPAPRYRIVSARGPEHSKTFTVEAFIGNEWVARGDGPTKKAAGQRAAQALLDRMAPSPVKLSPKIE